MDKGNHPGLFHLVIKLFPQLLYLPRCLRTRLVDGMANDGIDKGNHPGLFHLVVSSVASLTLLGSCSHTDGHRVAIC